MQRSNFGNLLERTLGKWRGWRRPEGQQFCVCSMLLARAQCWQWPELWTPELSNACSSQQERCLSYSASVYCAQCFLFSVPLLNPTSKWHAVVFPYSLLVAKGFHVFCLSKVGENNYLPTKNPKELRTVTDFLQSSCAASDIRSHKARIIKNMMFWQLLDILKVRDRKMSLFFAWRKQSSGEILLRIFSAWRGLLRKIGTKFL